MTHQQHPPVAPPTVEGEARRAFEDRPKAPEKPAEEPQPKTKAKPTGRKPIPNHLEAAEHELRPRACAGCGETALDVVDELIEEKSLRDGPVPPRLSCRLRELPCTSLETALP